MSEDNWEIEIDRRVASAVKQREKEIAQRLRDVGDVYGAGGHKHRCRMLHALADEIDGFKPQEYPIDIGEK